MQHTCHQCQATFTIAPDDLALYGRIGVSPPDMCHPCSERLRFSFRNERHYYKRKSNASGKDIISIYAPDSPYTVYHREEWFSDIYDPLAYGRAPTFTQPFFEQIKELSRAVPYEHMVIINSVNCDYCNFVVNAKNCYMSNRIDAEDVSYCYLAFGQTKDCIDCHTIIQCELCYECIDCTACYACRWCQRCRQCTDCSFCIDCIGCRNCFGCTGLRQKAYCVFNEQQTKEEYTRIVAEHDTRSFRNVTASLSALRALDLRQPHRFAIIEQSEDCSGDYISRSRNVRRSFDMEECQDCAESAGCEYSKDAVRSCFLYYGESCYEHLSCTMSSNVRFCYGTYDAHDVEYCMMVHNGTHDCFGSIGLKRNAYVILNKQYTQGEYADLRRKLIEYMKHTGEYGRFFPPSLCHFAYNETVAQDFYPLTKEEALQLGYHWRDDLDAATEHLSQSIAAADLPDSIHDASEDILRTSVCCDISSRSFRITKNELDFYRTHALPLPRLHPDERRRRRMALRNPRRLWDRQCTKARRRSGRPTLLSALRSSTVKSVTCRQCIEERYGRQALRRGRRLPAPRSPKSVVGWSAKIAICLKCTDERSGGRMPNVGCTLSEVEG